MALPVLFPVPYRRGQSLNKGVCVRAAPAGARGSQNDVRESVLIVAVNRIAG